MEVLNALLQADANPNFKNKNGNTAYDLTNNQQIKDIIVKYQIMRENLEKIESIRTTADSYLSKIPRDLINMIKHEFKNQLEKNIN